MLRLQKMSDERHAIVSSRRFTPAQPPCAVVHDWLGLAAYLVTRKMRYVRRPQRLAKHLQRVDEPIQLFPFDIRRWLHPDGKGFAQGWGHADTVDVQEIGRRQVAKIFLLAQHTDRVRR